MLSSHRLSNPEPGTSASELLEASKKLYVKTAILRQTRLVPDRPRMFTSGSDEEEEEVEVPRNLRPPVCFTPVPSTYNPLLSPQVSAFTKVTVRPAIAVLPPPIPPKSDYVKERARQYSNGHKPLLSLRSLPDCSQLGTSPTDQPFDGYRTLGKKPIPKPRLSLKKMAPLTLDESTMHQMPPVPLPRRKNLPVEEKSTSPDFHFNTPASRLEGGSGITPSKRNIAKSTPNLADGRPVTGIRRRILAAQGRSVTPLVQINQEHQMEQYDEEKDFLAAAMRDIEFGDDDDLENEGPELLMRFGRGNYATTSFQTPIQVSAPSSLQNTLCATMMSPLMSPSSPNSADSCSKSTKTLSTPTSKDSGLTNSDNEDGIIRRQANSKSDDDGFFDASGEKKTDGEASEGDSIFTSITNQPKGEEAVDSEENRGKPISELERKARVMRWINEAAIQI
ncbi:unnamed protein product, partial [Mesorhabditis spiculigera]